MKAEHNTQLESILRVLWLILGVLLLLFGYDHTPFGKSEQGALFAVVGLISGIGIFVFIVGRMIFGFLKALKEMADGQDES
jgi:hypothetical protein